MTRSQLGIRGLGFGIRRVTRILVPVRPPERGGRTRQRFEQRLQIRQTSAFRVYHHCKAPLVERHKSSGQLKSGKSTSHRNSYAVT